METQTVQIDQQGMLALPLHVMERLSLKAGDALAVAIHDGVIELRPSHETSKFKQVNGVLVLKSDLRLEEGRDLVAEAREARMADLTICSFGC